MSQQAERMTPDDQPCLIPNCGHRRGDHTERSVEIPGSLRNEKVITCNVCNNRCSEQAGALQRAAEAQLAQAAAEGAREVTISDLAMGRVLCAANFAIIHDPESFGDAPVVVVQCLTADVTEQEDDTKWIEERPMFFGLDGAVQFSQSLAQEALRAAGGTVDLTITLGGGPSDGEHSGNGTTGGNDE